MKEENNLINCTLSSSFNLYKELTLLYINPHICLCQYREAFNLLYNISMENLPFVNLPLDHISPAWFVLIAIFANAFPPIPEEIFLIYFGYLANLKPELISFTQIMTFLIIGLLIIDSVVYYLARRGHRIIDYILKKVLDVDIDTQSDFLKKHVNKIIFVSRFLVQLRALGPITAARVGTPFKHFLKVDFLALAVYVPVAMGVGYYFAHSIERIFSGTRVIHNIMFSGLIIIISIITLRKLRKMLLSEFSVNTMKKIKSTFNI